MRYWQCLGVTPVETIVIRGKTLKKIMTEGSDRPDAGPRPKDLLGLLGAQADPHRMNTNL